MVPLPPPLHLIPPGPRAWARPLGQAGAVACLYFLTGWAERLAAPRPEAVSCFWWPSGVALFAAWSLGRRAWPGIAVGEIAIVLSFGQPWYLGAATAAGNTLEAALGAWLLRWFRVDPRLDRYRDVLGLTAAVALCPAAMCLFQVTAYLITGRLSPPFALTTAAGWWANDFIGMLVLVPAFLTWTTPPPPKFSRRGLLISTGLYAGLGAVAYLGLSGVTVPAPVRPAFLVATVPLIALSAWRGGPRGASVTAAVLAGVTMVACWNEDGPFPQGTETVLRVPAANLFVGTVALAGYLLAALAAEKARALERAAARRQEEALGTLAGGLAHDLNNLLTPVLGYANLASSALPPDSPTSTHLQQIELAALRAADLIQRVLAYAGRATSFAQPVDFNALVRGTVESARPGWPPHLSVETTLGEGLPPLLADERQLRLMVSELITNAIEAVGPEGGRVRITTGTCLHASDRHRPGALSPHVSLNVADTGCGLDAATKGRIFDPFYTTKFQGRGLGLAVVLGIVRSRGGSVLVDSEPARGAQFTILLPVAPPSPAQHDGPPPAPSREPNRLGTAR